MSDSTTTPTQGAPAEPERTFTQAEMDAIIGDRLKRERAKYADYEDVKAKAQQFDAAQEAATREIGVTEMRLFTMGMPNSSSMSQPVLTRFPAQRQILS